MSTRALDASSLAIYQIYVDAFARGSSGQSQGRHRGGDLEGVVERLDYVAALGVDAIWLTPIFASPSDHGYNITDYYRVDPRLVPPGLHESPEQLFRHLVDRAHGLGLAVLLDLPLNHVAHAYDLDATGLEPAPRTRPPRTRQEHGWSLDLKYFDHDDDATRAFLFDVARHWITHYGVDGYRYDYVHGIANPFWEDLYRELREIRADLFVVGEHWDDFGSPEMNARDIASRFDGSGGPCFDTLFDFPFQAAVVEAVDSGSPDRLAEIMDLCDAIYPRPACSMLDNHDTARIADWADGDWRRIRPALRVLATRTGPISILYGTEVGLASGHPPRPTFDESSRIPMRWDLGDDEPCRQFRRCLGARREHAVFGHGRVLHRRAWGGLFVEAKEFSSRRALVLSNFAGRVSDVGIDLRAVTNVTGRLEALCGGDPVDLVDGVIVSPVPAYGGGVYLLP